MPRYQVFQDDKPADTKSYPEIGQGLGWDNSVFDTFDEALYYAYEWAYPHWRGFEFGEDYTTKMELDTPVNMSMSEFPVMMEIREVE